MIRVSGTVGFIDPSNAGQINYRITVVIRRFGPVPGIKGVEVIRKALSEGLELGQSHEKSSVEIYSLGSPRYKLRIVSPDYKEAEEILSQVLENVTKTIQKNNGAIAFNRK